MPLSIGQTSPDSGANINLVIRAGLMLFMALTTSAQAIADDNNSGGNGYTQMVTVTLQQMDISVQPVGNPFNVTLSIQKDYPNNVTIQIPTINQTFNSSRNSPNFEPDSPMTPFPTLAVDSSAGGQDLLGAVPRQDYSYPSLPPDYPLGGYIDTVDNA